jgi:hypothetical protein
MSKFIIIIAVLALTIAFPSRLQSSDLGRSADTRFQQAAKALEEIEARTESAIAAGEIAVAKRWIEDGRLLIESGKIEKAAQIAERLPFQLDLIRIVIATGLAMEEAKQVEKEVFELEQELKVLKARRDRLLLEKLGPKISNAFPPLEEAGK